MPSYYCKHPTCNAILAQRGWCDAHRAEAAQAMARIQRIADAHRDPLHVKFYHSKQWIALSNWVLRSRPICDYCNDEIATGVHHVVPLRKDWARRLDPGNLKSVGPKCHATIEAQERRRERRQGVG